MTDLTLNAYAKINLGLKIFRRRSDGYHDLYTIMQRITLADVIALELVGTEIFYDGPVLTKKPEDNLVIKAARRFINRFGLKTGVRIRLEKNIPVGAGLGGGSSDAAAVLRGLAKLCSFNDHKAIIMDIARELGADVPFFVNDIPCALAEGIGDRLSSVSGLSNDSAIILFMPDFTISTAWAYKKADEHLTFDEKNVKISVPKFCRNDGGIKLKKLFNDFEIPVFKYYPELAKIKSRLIEYGAITAGMTGSGSVIYGIFKDRLKAEITPFLCPPTWTSSIYQPI